MNLKNIFRKKTVFLSLIGLGIVAFFAQVIIAHASASLAGGDFVQAFNNTTQAGTWSDPVSASPGEIIEFRVTAKNSGDQPADDVQIWGSVTGQVPQGPEMQLTLTGKIATASFGGNEVTDTATVNVSGDSPQGLRYEPGHARLNGVTNKFNCPNTCDIGDDVLGGINVGTIQPGDFVEVTFKAGLTNDVPVTPTPTETPTPTPTPEVTVTPTPEPQANLQCPAGFISVVSGSNIQCIQQVQNNDQNQTVNQSVTATGGSSSATGGSASVNITQQQPAAAIVQPVRVVAAAGQTKVAGVTTIKELPKTGLPMVAWALSGLLPAGLGLRRFGSEKNLKSGARYLWQKREFDRA